MFPVTASLAVSATPIKTVRKIQHATQKKWQSDREQNLKNNLECNVLKFLWFNDGNKAL